MVIIVDYGMGNLGSILNMFKRIGVRAYVTSELPKIEDAEKLLLPGVGSFDHAIDAINSNGLRAVLDKKALKERVPILGVCLGMQLLTYGSDEGSRDGLGWIPGRASVFETNSGLKVPHMGWNVTISSQKSRLTEGLGEISRFYFVHSYCVHVDNPDYCILTTKYGIEFASGIQKNNIFGVQFHPEKSHKFGMKILKNFADL
jgi:glutamine amidotransferase